MSSDQSLLGALALRGARIRVLEDQLAAIRSSQTAREVNAALADAKRRLDLPAPTFRTADAVLLDLASALASALLAIEARLALLEALESQRVHRDP